MESPTPAASLSSHRAFTPCPLSSFTPRSAPFSSASGSSSSRLVVSAKIRKTKRAPMDPDYPWPEKYKAEEEGFLDFLSRTFRNNTRKDGKVMVLPFERPLQELETKIEEVSGAEVSRRWRFKQGPQTGQTGAGFLESVDSRCTLAEQPHHCHVV